MKNNNDDRKCRDTKILVKIAIENGMTNQEIAVKAGLKKTSGAVVTRWKTGVALATERQMNFLINEFGDLLRRKTEHLFSQDEDGIQKFYKLNGEVIFKHVVRKYMPLNKGLSKIALLRYLALQKGNKFHLVFQSRKGLDQSAKLDHYQIAAMSHCDNEDANWDTDKVISNKSADIFIDEVDKVATSLMTEQKCIEEKFIYSAKELQFIARKSLLKQGFQLAGIVDLSLEQ